MDRLRVGVFAALVTGLIGALPASAQTAANISIVSGNGQIICQTCTTSLVRFFQPLVVRVTDAGGQPIVNKTVNWNIIAFQGGVGVIAFGNTTTTDGNGVTNNIYNQNSQPGSFAQTFLQTTIQVTADSASAIFTETLGLSDANNNRIQYIAAKVNSPNVGATLSGTAGASGFPQVQVHVDAFGQAIPNASVSLQNGQDPATSPSVSCATGAGADPGMVLTNSTGDAFCTPIFGSIAGTGNFSVLVGAAAPTDPTVQPLAYFQSAPPFGLRVAPGVAGQVQVSSSNPVSANPGKPLGSPLVAKVTDASGNNTISGAGITWAVTPAGAATLNPTSGTSDSQGLVSTNVTISPSAGGIVTVKATLNGTSLSATFTINVNVTITGLQKVSGDGQTALTSGAFANPLVVQVNGSTGQPVPNFLVNFSIAGPGSLSSQTATTDSSGQARVTVQAGGATGTITVTATVSGLSQPFTLTVIPQGPNLTSSSFYNGAGFARGSMSPCSIVTIIASGLAPTVQGVVVSPNFFGPQPYTLAGDKVSFNGSQAPIFNVANTGGQEQLTAQVPCDVTPGNNVTVSVNVSGGSASTVVGVQSASPGIFETTMSDGVKRAVMVRPDGSFVSLENPARQGDLLRVYVTGLGPTSPAISTNSMPIPGTDSLVLGQVIVGVNNAGAGRVSARVAPNLIGVYEVSFQVPSDAPIGNNVVLSVAVNPNDGSGTQFSNGSKIPIQ